MDTEALRKRLTELTNEVSAVQGDALEIPGHAYAKAIAAIQSGSADYTDAELDAATGSAPALPPPPAAAALPPA